MNFIRRMGSGDKEPEVVGTYLVLTVILHLSGLANPPWFAIRGYEWIVLLLIGLAAVLVRRRFLVASSVAMLLAGAGLLAVGSIGGYFLVFECVFGLFLLGSVRTRTVALALLCLAAISLAIATWLGTRNPQEVVLVLLMAGFILFTPMLWAENVRTAKELARAEAQRAEAVQSAADAREDQLVAEHDFSRVQERTALAREMHDVLSARFSSIALLSGALLPAAPRLRGHRCRASAMSRFPAWRTWPQWCGCCMPAALRCRRGSRTCPSWWPDSAARCAGSTGWRIRSASARRCIPPRTARSASCWSTTPSMPRALPWNLA
ncbi:histidine kinase dimerization/phosphoacceptor domain-containing protein [Glutamicibacter sp. M10]|uniref:histidine kinase dimerization/phosphoacceptor domain-containing protein n=1 Tax=Glutamicibacter sp. M10 TaxID=3023076 RepID=UPI0021C94E2A|nr:histidine kinase dimerization/phosphoacceptor domain-containing protein [Glutamicibacter sp. M10]UXN31826.1 histidine kinase dimerization/phosphoacceptor domain-containing protein [Glutamicibacter sp. M10]